MAYASTITQAECGHLQLSQTMLAIGETVYSNDDGTKEALAVEAGSLLKSKSTIHRFPSNLRRIGKEKDYITPTTVAIGPYHRDLPEIQAMEKVKRAALDYFFEGLNAESREAARNKIISIARDTRGCYADADALKGITDDGFAHMMFVDGCFLVQVFMDSTVKAKSPSPQGSMIQLHLLGILRDILLLENQIPWPVMEYLMDIRGLQIRDIVSLLSTFGLEVNLSPDEPIISVVDEPSHLLCLIRSYKVGTKNNKGVGGVVLAGKALPISTSAAELAEMGIKLKASKKPHFSDMHIMKGPVLATLSLAPMYLDSIVACWLVNMAAFEMCTEITSTDDYSVNSYLCVLGLLMNQENDVRKLRLKRILHGFFSDQQTLEFFKGLGPNLLAGQAYWRLITDLDEYKRKRRMWITVYWLLHNNAKTIAAVLTVIGGLVGIFKALYSLKKNQQ